jgi:hypothetical protein
MQSPGNYAIQEFGTLAGLVKLQAAARPDHVAITDCKGRSPTAGLTGWSIG